MIGEFLMSYISKINFALGRKPTIPKAKRNDAEKYIPKPYKAVFVIAADFELAWAWRYAAGDPNPMKKALQRAQTARKNIPKILALCDTHSIPITWATVGHLFLESCKKNGNVPHAHVARLPHHKNQYWIFNKGDWFDGDPCTNWERAKEWYAPDLVDSIMRSNTKHEIACHTFSHIDCRDDVCTDPVFKREVQECINLAEQRGIRLRSFIYPANLVGNLRQLKEMGFTSYRSARDNVLGYPRRDDNGLWELPSTAELRYRKAWSMGYHVARYQEIIRRGVMHNRLIYLWFHPSMEEEFRDHVIAPLFSYIAELSKTKQATVMTTASYIDFLEKVNGM